MLAQNEADSEPRTIIGGMFGLHIEASNNRATVQKQPDILTRHHLRLVTARSAFSLLAESLRPSAVWIPSYICNVVVDALVGSGARIKFYEVGENMRIIDNAWIAEVDAGDMVIFIDYFGCNFWNSSGKEVKERGAWVVEDACQAMLNTRFSQFADYVVASPRKFVGVPDGGILSAQNGAALPADELPPPPSEWWLDALKASQLRAEFDRRAGDRQWFELFRKTDACAPIDPARMSELSSLLLDNSIDWTAIAARRCDNYSQLAARLTEFGMFDELPEDVVPLGFPVRVQNREQVRSGMFKSEIYPPVHWPIEKSVPKRFEASHRLAKQIMTLPCDQRYSPEDMDRLCQSFLSLSPEPADRTPVPLEQ